MIVIGIDPHKSTHTATALDSATNTDLGSIRIDASVIEYKRLIVWAKAWPDRRWAIENADGLGHHLALWLLAIGEVVHDIPTTATARVRELSRGGRRKNDRIDAAAAASVAALHGDARQVYPETVNDALALLDERRVNLSSSRTRTVNQLHALLRELMAGGAPTSLTPKKAAAAIRGFRARTAPDKIRLELAKELITDFARFDEQLAANSRKITALLDEHGTHLRNIDGVGPVLAARILGRSGRASRFPTAAAYASYTGTAPVQIASADSSHHRLSRFGDRQLNSALYTIAMIQIRMPSSTGRAFYDKKIAEGKHPGPPLAHLNGTSLHTCGESCSQMKNGHSSHIERIPHCRLTNREAPETNVWAVPGLRTASQADSMTSTWGPLGAHLRTIDRNGATIIVDAGRIGHRSGPHDLMVQSDLILVVTRTSATALGSLKGVLDQLRGQLRAIRSPAALGLVVIDDKYYGAAEIAKSFGVDVAFTLPDSPKHAKIFSEGHQLTKFQRTQSRYLRNLEGAWPKMQTYVEEHRPEWVNASRNQTLPSNPSTREALGESS